MERDLDIAQTYERVFGIYRSQLGLLLPAALVLFVPVAIVTALVSGIAGQAEALPS